MPRISELYEKYKVESWLVFGGIGVCIVYAIVQKIVMSDPGRANFTIFLGVPLDDVYIHLRYARNLQHGFGYSFNPREILTADTSPLWVILIAMFGSFSSHLELVAIALSIVSYLIIAPGIYRTSRDLLGVSEKNARLAGIASVLTSRLAWSAMSGMETALAALLILLAVEAHIRVYQQRCVDAKEALWLGLGLLVRPEFGLVAIVLFAHWIYIGSREKINAQRAGLAILLFSTLAAPCLLLCLATNGSLISHSSIVQAATANVSSAEYLLFAIKTLAEPNILLILLAIVAIFSLYRHGEVLVIAVIVVLFALSQAFFAPQTRHHGRYLFVLFPIVILIAIVAYQEYALRLSDQAQMIFIIAVIAFGVISTARWAYLAASDVRNINDQHLAAAKWIIQNHRSADTIASGDVGAIGFYTDYHVLDPNGLITLTAWNARLNPDSLWHVLRGYGANVFVIYPRWDREFFARYRDSLIPRGSLTVRLPLTASADTTLNIYRLRNGS